MVPTPVGHPSSDDAWFSTIHRPYYYDDQEFRTVVLRRAQ
jgi:hypothetical protein